MAESNEQFGVRVRDGGRLDLSRLRDVGEGPERWPPLRQAGCKLSADMLDAAPSGPTTTETVNGLYKAELIERGRPWASVEQVEGRVPALLETR